MMILAALVSRQYVDMSRIRIEGLLAAFPKLVGSGKQHTYVETENVRYVYQPMETLYLLLVTNKQSNILEDLDTLRTLSKLVSLLLTFSGSSGHWLNLVFIFWINIMKIICGNCLCKFLSLDGILLISADDEFHGDLAHFCQTLTNSRCLNMCRRLMRRGFAKWLLKSYFRLMK